MSRLALLCALAIALSACSVTVPVRGEIQNVNETFAGTTTGYMDRSGILTVICSKGASCTGDWVLETSRTGAGVFRCNDGRSGPFQFVSTGRHGNGQGSLGGQ